MCALFLAHRWLMWLRHAAIGHRGPSSLPLVATSQPVAAPSRRPPRRVAHLLMYFGERIGGFGTGFKEKTGRDDDSTF
ncbi:hypothetical protein JOL62DRAFT_582633 [Phyllosticta paracitricarpa]|uniref:Secreted protein n=1 Tax=Phyllosticta paracitricarpa TaxID=2016321 RepID=A0ABR1MZQ2_9PEZI